MLSTDIKEKESKTNTTIKEPGLQKSSNEESGSVSPMKTDGPEIPSSMTLPKGGGAIQGIGEKFDTNYFTGTMSVTIPIFTTPSRSDFYPKLSLSYDSAGHGNGPFGMGWNISIPSITRKTELGLPRYMDAKNPDNFILSGSEDLVPLLNQDDYGKWIHNIKDETYDKIQYSVQYYRPRIEGLFALVKKCTNKTTGDVHWRSISKENVTTIYGKSSNSQISDPDNPAHIFKWMIEESFDDKGNVIVYQYKEEDASNVEDILSYESNRLKNGKFSNKYIKRIFYGNQTPHIKSDWLFEIVFDYGEHDIKNNPEKETAQWPVRQDPFSTYRSGFEIRTYRLCKSIMVFHNFNELGNIPCLVHSTDLRYLQGPIFSFLKFVTSTGYKQNKNKDGTYTLKSMPPIEFTNFHPHIDYTVHQIDLQSLENIPIGIDGNSYQWIDLQSEGIAGILSQQDGSWYYKHNLGNGQFGPMTQVSAMPLGVGQNGKQQITELEDDGQKYVVQYQRPLSGYCKLKDNENWEPFVPFESTPNIDWNDPNLKFVDLDGDGFADLLISQSDIFVWYHSRGKEGFGSYHVVPKEYDEEKGPALVFADSTQSIYIADMSGDGLADIVRIRNGEVCYWPNLGYGKFGTKITMDSSPVFDNVDQFDNNRIRLVDIDGSGTSDILYIGRNEIRFWFNQSGNSFSKENVINYFPAVDQLSSVMTLDLLGKGTTCVVWSSQLQEDAGRQMQYVDLMGGVKPYLLYSINNNMGSETRIGYVESTKFYLEDLKSGNPWITKIPFPIHVVERVETFDYLSNTKRVSTMKYHHGYYDRHEREFRGFGLVEHWDTESFDEFNTANLFFEEPDNSDQALHVPPVYTKTWYHTGAYHKEGLISRHYEKEYYQGDPKAALLSDSIVPSGLSQEDIYEALRSLKGQILRQEVYGLDCSDKQNDPYAVSEHNYEVTMFQSAEHIHGLNMFQSAQHMVYGVFFYHQRETLDYHYERNPSDPRIEHKFILQLDSYGNVEKQVTVYYPRRAQGDTATVFQEQSVVKAIVNLIDYAQIVNNPQDTWLVGVECQSKSYEISGLTMPPDNSYFDFDYINSVVLPLKNGSTDFNIGPVVLPGTSLNSVIDFGVDFTSGQLQARIFSAQRKYYWQDISQTYSNLGQISVPLLPSYAESVVFPQIYVTKIYGTKVTDTILTTEGGYQKDVNTGYWWDHGKTQYYLGSTQFYLPNITVDPFGSYDPTTKTGIFYQLDYDGYNLVPIQYTDPLNNKIKISAIDYRLLRPNEMIDFNCNNSQAVYDELGMIEAFSIFGKIDGAKAGDGDITNFQLPDGTTLDDIISKTDIYIQNATAFFYYDYLAWVNEKNPPYSASVQRVLHQSDQPADTNPTFQISILYADGRGRTLQKKLMAESGNAWAKQTDGSYSEQQCNTRWITTGRTVYNNKGKPVKQYEPFYSASYDWDSEESLTEFGVTPIIHYDPLERVIKTDTPKGFFSSILFDPWSQENWDENDNVVNSNLYYAIVTQGQNPYNWNAKRLLVEKNALTDTQNNSGGTPKTMHLDTMGHTFMEIDELLVGGTKNQLFTYYGLDINGNKLWMVDPRQYLSNQTRAPANKVLSFQFYYDMQNRQLESVSMDAGVKLILQNALNKPVYLWTARAYQINTTYDLLQRPKTVTVTGNELTNNLVEIINYGESDPNAIQNNLRGKPITHYDQAGVKKFLLYNLEGQNIKLQTMIRDDYNYEVDWKKNPATPENFKTQTSFDTLGQAISQVHTDGNGNQIDNRQYQYHQSSRLKSIQVQLDQKSSLDYYVSDIKYNAKSQRLETDYGNGTSTFYVYEEKTFRLETQLTKTSSGKKLQNILYVYDPVGNITYINDSIHETVFTNQIQVQPTFKYTYDGLYRLVYAEGRQHQAVQYDDYKNPNAFKQSRYLTIPINDSTALEPYSQTFSYDEAGNLWKIVHVVTTNSSRGWTKTQKFYDDSNRILSSQVGSTLPQTFTFDNAGNMTSLDQIGKIQWNYRDNISSAVLLESSDGLHDNAEYYVYDSSGRRTRKILETFNKYNNEYISKQVEEKIYLDGYEIKRIHAVNLKINSTALNLERFSCHVMDDQKRIAIIHRWTIDTNAREVDSAPDVKNHYQIGNNLDSCILEIDKGENVISYEEFYPYGGTSYIAGNSTSASLAKEVSIKDYRYTGKECDDSTGLYYYGARYYVPWLGRWVSPDPVGIKDGINVFSAFHENPIRFIDPNGLTAYNSPVVGTPKTVATGLAEIAKLGEAEGVEFGLGLNPSSGQLVILQGSRSQVAFGEYIPLAHTHTGSDTTVPPSTDDLNVLAERQVQAHGIYSTEQGWGRLQYDPKSGSFEFLRTKGGNVVRSTISENPNFDPSDRSPVGQASRWTTSPEEVVSVLGEKPPAAEAPTIGSLPKIQSPQSSVPSLPEASGPTSSSMTRVGAAMDAIDSAAPIVGKALGVAGGVYAAYDISSKTAQTSREQGTLMGVAQLGKTSAKHATAVLWFTAGALVALSIASGGAASPLAAAAIGALIAGGGTVATHNLIDSATPGLR